MYKYELYQDSPEGIDWIMKLVHEKCFTQKEFANEMEDVICETFEETMKDPESFVLKSYMDDEKLAETLKKHGFSLDTCSPHATYGYSPFDGADEFDDKLGRMLKKIESCHKERKIRKAEKRKIS